MSSQLTAIPARHGIATPLRAGQTIKIINTYGTQVVDTWAFTLSSFPPSSSTPPSEIATQMSMQHTRASLNRIIPKVGDGLYDNKRRKLLEIVEDTTEGVHDTLIAACDDARYRELGGGEGHRNCADNLVEGLGALGIKAPQFTPSPLNLFMNIPVHDDHTTLSFEAPTSKEGEYICLKAEMDLMIAFSACPQDILKINFGKPVDAHFQILLGANE
ncbi:Aminomethyltransferase [Hyaloscypha bicolor E]|uniref:Aminomethyltransferase n=1 Tax=Hyaloscypha bicolor E TaxID=1095630 RepID=A0A2J6T3X2_9HELO|nr:Aminomethyltransferase [Hyaloscypha bicolor E]PMD57740.1 Aminomethyltransferase [Hyaloscypha bicolor E]